MKILVINAGSSSLKYQLIDMEDESVIAKGNCERIGVDGLITHKVNGYELKQEASFPTHAEAFEKLVEVLLNGEHAVIKSIKEISAVGHRIVQGAEIYTESVIITPEVIEKIEGIAELAPLHNPAHVLAMRACQKVFDKSVPQVCVFDTAFHATMPKKAYMFGVPYEYYEKYSIRKYGFHGTSHRFVSHELASLLNKDISELKIITCHLGNGCSIAAVDKGKVVDTSMGFTPLDGLIMGTRSGAVDPSVLTFIIEKENLSAKQLSDLLNKKSGYLGISGISSDHRDLCAAADNGNERAKIAIDMQIYQIQRYIGAYTAAMDGLDAIVFTGGIGENSPFLREAVCKGLKYFGVEIDKEKNVVRGKTENLTAKGAKTQVWAIATNEELLIARDTLQLVSKTK